MGAKMMAGEVMKKMKMANELSDTELRQAYVIATRKYNEAYKEKKDLENEMFSRYEKELEENRRG